MSKQILAGMFLVLSVVYSEALGGFLAQTVAPTRGPFFEVSAGINRFPRPGINVVVGDSGIPQDLVEAKVFFLEGTHTSSALAAGRVDVDPVSVVLTTWIGAFSDNAGSSSFGSRARVLLVNMDFTVLPSAGENIGDFVTLFVHFDFLATGNGGPGEFIESARVLNPLSRQVIVQFDSLETRTVPIVARYGDRFALDLATSATAAKQGITGIGVNRADIKMSLTFDADPPPLQMQWIHKQLLFQNHRHSCS